MADDGFDTLPSLLASMNSSITDIATHTAVTKAKASMDQIKQSTMKDAEQYSALKGLSDQLALQLAGVGASQGQIQTAVSAVAPQAFGSAEQQIIEGTRSGNQGMLASGIKARDIIEAPAQKLKQQQQATSQQNADTASLNVWLDHLDAQAKSGGKLGDVQSKELGNAQSAFNREAKGLFEQKQKAEQIAAMNVSEIPQGDNTVKVMIERYAGLQRPPAQLIGMFGTSQSGWNQMKTSFKKYATGLATDEDRANIQKFSQALAPTLDKEISDIAEKQAMQLTSRTDGFTVRDAMSRINPQGKGFDPLTASDAAFQAWKNEPDVKAKLQSDPQTAAFVKSLEARRKKQLGSNMSTAAAPIPEATVRGSRGSK